MPTKHLQKPGVRAKRVKAILAANALKRKWNVNSIKKARRLEASSRGGKASRLPPNSERLIQHGAAQALGDLAADIPFTDVDVQTAVGGYAEGALREEVKHLRRQVDEQEVKLLRNFYRILCRMQGLE